MAISSTLAPTIEPKVLWTLGIRNLPGSSVLLHAPTRICVFLRGVTQCTTIVVQSGDQQAPRVIRRSANYQPPIWTYDYVQSLTSDYEGSKYTKRSNELKRQVKMMLDSPTEEPVEQLELIDNLQRLGVSYHFQNEIKRIMENIHKAYDTEDTGNKEGLYNTALGFRLLRQHGLNVPEEIFNSFQNMIEDHLGTNHSEDTRGLLCLYEASYLAMEGESILEWAKKFTTKHLKEKLDGQNMDKDLEVLVHHALELPLHWRIPRLEARWYINMYEQRSDTNHTLLEFAKLDFNMVQAAHQSDLKYASKWWKDTCLGEKLPFARDRLMENFLWTVGVIFEPRYGYCRKMLTKINALITTIDDVYDVYGTLDELELFTTAIERWEINAIEQLPDYMQTCFLELYNSINGIAYDTLEEQGIHTISYLKKAWADLCRCYLKEAKWYFSGYTMTLEEYLDNAWISISAPLILVHAYFFVSNPITSEALEHLKNYRDIIRWSSMILRLANDLGTSSYELKRGDVPKSIQCHMNQIGVSEEKAREHIRFLISKAWEKMNRDHLVANSPFVETFIRLAINLARMSQCMYQYGDGHGTQSSETKDRVLALFVVPIPL